MLSRIARYTLAVLFPVYFFLLVVIDLSRTDGRSLNPVWQRPFIKAFSKLGLMQSWRMYASTKSQNCEFKVKVQLEDGSEVIWNFPKLTDIGGLERYRVNRFMRIHQVMIGRQERLLEFVCQSILESQARALAKVGSTAEILGACTDIAPFNEDRIEGWDVRQPLPDAKVYHSCQAK